MDKLPRFVLAFVLLTSFFFINGCSGGSPYKSNGERIYFTSTNSSGQPITYSGGFMMMRLSCVNCHGPQGHGGTINMMGNSFNVPNITWPVLTSSTSDRPAYKVNTVKEAITAGTDPERGNLEFPMPVWHMADNDLNDLVLFIMTLK